MFRPAAAASSICTQRPLLAVAGCAPATTVPEESAASTPAVITAEELNTMLQSKNFPLINVHIPYEGEIPDTDAHIPYNEIEKYTDQLPPDKSAKLVLYCRSGGGRSPSRSVAASKTLIEMGYTDVVYVQGGMKAWQAAGYELLNDSK